MKNLINFIESSVFLIRPQKFENLPHGFDVFLFNLDLCILKNFWTYIVYLKTMRKIVQTVVAF